MQLVILALGIYVLFAEWRNTSQKKKIDDFMRSLKKLTDEKSLWYSGVLPKSNELCLFQETNDNYIINKLSDKYWLKKDGSVDFARIKRWVYINDLNNI